MSENYVNSDGFKPLLLPSTGFSLYVGRQYYLSPAARVVIEDVYGLRGIPSVVTCLLAQARGTSLHIVETDSETGEVIRDEIQVREAQHATFEAFFALRRKVKFTLDLAMVHEREAAYEEADQSEDVEVTKREKFVSPELAEFRRRVNALAEKDPRTKRAKTKAPLDLSLLDL